MNLQLRSRAAAGFDNHRVRHDDGRDARVLQPAEVFLYPCDILVMGNDVGGDKDARAVRANKFNRLPHILQ
ncbi:hypothetical protein D3C73_1465080 [compost metagenome]